MVAEGTGTCYASSNRHLVDIFHSKPFDPHKTSVLEFEILFTTIWVVLKTEGVSIPNPGFAANFGAVWKSVKLPEGSPEPIPFAGVLFGLEQVPAGQLNPTLYPKTLFSVSFQKAQRDKLAIPK